MLNIEQMRNRAFDLMIEALDLLDLLDSSECTMSGIHLAQAIDLMPPLADGTARADRAALMRTALDNLLDGQTDK